MEQKLHKVDRRRLAKLTSTYPALFREAMGTWSAESRRGFVGVFADEAIEIGLEPGGDQVVLAMLERPVDRMTPSHRELLMNSLHDIKETGRAPSEFGLSARDIGKARVRTGDYRVAASWAREQIEAEQDRLAFLRWFIDLLEEEQKRLAKRGRKAQLRTIGRVLSLLGKAREEEEELAAENASSAGSKH